MQMQTTCVRLDAFSAEFSPRPSFFIPHHFCMEPEHSSEFHPREKYSHLFSFYSFCASARVLLCISSRTDQGAAVHLPLNRAAKELRKGVRKEIGTEKGRANLATNKFRRNASPRSPLAENASSVAAHVDDSPGVTYSPLFLLRKLASVGCC